MIPGAAAAVAITPADHALIADLAGRNTHKGTTMGTVTRMRRAPTAGGA